MNRFTTKVMRLMRLIELLSTHCYKSSAQLAEELGVSVRTVKRYIDDLSQMGVPVQSGKEGYRIMDRKLSSAAEKILHNKEHLLMFLFFSRFVNIEISFKILREFSFSGEVSELIRRIRESVLVEPLSTIGDTELELLRACVERKAIRITHRKLETDGLTHRTIYPLVIFFRDGRWYLLGYCKLRDDLRVFRVSNIQKIEHLRESFDMSDKKFYSKAEKFLGEFLIRPRLERPVTVQLRVKKWVAEYLERTPLTPLQTIEKEKGKDTYLVTLRLRDPEWLIPWMFKFAEEVEVIQPKSLAREAIKWGKAFLQSMENSLNEGKGEDNC